MYESQGFLSKRRRDSNLRPSGCRTVRVRTIRRLDSGERRDGLQQLRSSFYEPGLHLSFAFDVDHATGFTDELLLDQFVGSCRYVYATGDSVGFHPGRGIDSVSPDVVLELVCADHTSDDWARADTNPKIDPVSAHGWEGRKVVLHVKCQTGDCSGMVIFREWNTRRHHVPVADRADLLDVVILDKSIEHRVDLIEPCDQLLGREGL